MIILRRLTLHPLILLGYVLYRSVNTNRWVILHSFLRMGVNGGLDNETAGPIVCGIGEDRSLTNHAVNKFGKMFFSYPNWKIKFEGVIPSYDDLCRRALAIANQLLYVRLKSLDTVLADRGRWRPIEVNLRATTIRFSQYTGKSFFGEYTGDVVDFCKNSHWTLFR